MSQSSRAEKPKIVVGKRTAIVVIALLLVVIAWFDGAFKEPSPPKQAPPPPVPLRLAQLPENGPKLVDILDQPSAAVTKILGQPVGTLANSKKFQFGQVALYIIFDHGLAVSVAVSAEQPQARLDRGATLQWLGLAGSGDFHVGTHRVHLDSGSDETELAFQDDAWAAAEAKREEADKAKADAELNAQLRKKFAALEDRNFLEHGYNAQVAVDGTVLRIQWALCSRAMLFQMFDDDDRVNLKKIGFTRVVCDDGDVSAYFNLTQ